VLDDRGGVAASSPVNLSRVPRERGGCHAYLLANVPSDLCGGVAELVGDEAEEPQRGELDSKADPLAGTAVRAQPAQILQREREVGGEITLATSPGQLASRFSSSVGTWPPGARAWALPVAVKASCLDHDGLERGVLVGCEGRL
jgi:hypothetical protein